MLVGTSSNDRLEVAQLPMPTTSGTFSVIWRDAKSKTSGLTAQGILNTCPMSYGQRWIFDNPTNMGIYRRALKKVPICNTKSVKTNVH